jgi:hypothetical protein
VPIFQQHTWTALLAITLGAWLVAQAPSADAQPDPYAAYYCDPSPGTKLLYSNRAYEIEPKPAGAPPLYYTYKILAPANQSQNVERESQFLFDDGSDPWEMKTSAEEIQGLWPLRPDKQVFLYRVNPRTKVADSVSLRVLGITQVGRGKEAFDSWELRRIDHYSDGTQFFQFLWYAPGICTLSAFTDSQHRFVRLLRVLNPGDSDYNRPLRVKHHHLYFADTNERVR